jgi:2-isopropylmalate synthase
MALAKEIVDNKMSIDANCAARTAIVDIDPIIEVSQKTGLQLEASLFIGSSPIRKYVENWTLDQMLKLTEEAVTYAKKNDLKVMYVTEDTTRADPETLRRMYTTAIECGAERACVADTVGHATPHGTTMLVSFIKGVIEDTGKKVKIDWHGHRDRGLSVSNCLAAVAAGASRVHGTALGVGERAGNTAMELLLINFRLLGLIDNDLTKLGAYCDLVSKACGVPIPSFQSVVGSDAFRTTTGVHASAVVKAQKKGHHWLADRIYSSVPADWVGRQQLVEIGPMSGAANVKCWLEANGHKVTQPLVQSILEAAKTADKRLATEEIEKIIKSHA